MDSLWIVEKIPIFTSHTYSLIGNSMIKYLILIFIVGVSFSYELEPFLQCVKLQIDKNNDLADEANQNPEEFRKRPNFSGWPKYLSIH